jgi:serine/threonine protein kinase/Flp pilus assembly protein TadD
MKGAIEQDRSREIQEHVESCDTCRSAIQQFDVDATLVVRPPQAGLDVTVSVAESEQVPGDADTDATIVSSPSERMARHLPRIEGYRIVGILGQGGMGIVYRAVQNKLNRTVALKVLPAIVGTASPSAVARFRREATSAARLHHTNIIPIYDFGESRDAYYYAMELITGEPLNTLIKRFGAHHVSSATVAVLDRLLPGRAPTATEDDAAHPIIPATALDSSVVLAAAGVSGRGRPYYQHVARWMADAADALFYAHGQGIIHRDIKPANLILATDGRIMIADFGLAKSATEESVTMTGSLVGTLRYMSPEQTMAKRVRVDHRTDIYSLGATMYELLCFQPAHAGTDDKQILGAILSREPTSPRKIVHAVPPELETICFKAMEKSADARYPTAKELADDLRRYVNDLPISAKRPGPIRRFIKFTRRRKALVSAVTAAALLVASTVLWRVAEERSRVATVNSLYDSGMFYGGQKKWDSSIGEFKKALEIDPRHVKSLLGLAWVRWSYYNALPTQEDTMLLIQAEDACRKARAVDPNSVAALNLHGVVLKKLERYPEAIETYQTIIQLTPANQEQEPHFAAAWSNLGMLYALTGDLDKAKEHLRHGAELVGKAPNAYSAMAWRNLAAIELHTQDPAGVQHVKDAISCDKDDLPSWVLQARLRTGLAEHADHAEALDDAKYADRMANYGDGHAKRVRALAHLRNRQYAEAVEHARLALEQKDLEAINHLIIALAEARRGDAAAARGALQSAQAAWPEKLQDPAGVLVSADKGDLWFDSAAELYSLRAEVEQLLADLPAAPPDPD